MNQYNVILKELGLVQEEGLFNNNSGGKEFIRSLIQSSVVNPKNRVTSLHQLFTET